jgi:hypothetical protein
LDAVLAGYVRRYSATLAIFLLKVRRPKPTFDILTYRVTN